MKNFFFLTLLYFILSCQSRNEELPLPNILWITSEDNSPFAGCYGDDFATTPNMDKLAARGFLYTHAYANAPVCAPARNTIITGVYANSGGHQHMRSTYSKSDVVKLYPEYLKAAGYYCTNNVKTDYNIEKEQKEEIWDEVSREAHYKNRAPGQPFFAIFNSTISHESSIHTSIPDDQLRHRPEDVKLPPYHPDTPEMRHDWAQYYDKVEDMDTWMGEILLELEESGEAENTIIFYYGDHGGVIARSKRYVYETGTRVPFIVYIPEKYKHLYPAEKPGSKVSRIISFVDLVPTLLSIIGTDIPEYLQGQAFLGKQKTDDPDYAHMFRGRMDERYDMSRATRDHKYRYIRNYMPYRVYGQYLEYLWRAPSIQSWEAAYKNGQCNEIQSIFWNTKPSEELYDTENDPWEVNNLASDPNYSDVLDRLRNTQKDWMIRIKDTGFIPEADLISRAAGSTVYDYMRNSNVNVEKLVEIAEMATADVKPTDAQIESWAADENPAVRYWAATALLIHGTTNQSTKDRMYALAKDSSPNVAVVAAEALYKAGEPAAGKASLISALQADNEFARTHAMNAIDCVNENSKEVQDAVLTFVKSQETLQRNRYDLRAAKGLFRKWGVDEKAHGIEMDW